MRRFIFLPLAACLAASVLGTVAPAQAAPARPILTNVDTSAPGHLTADVATAAAWVFAYNYPTGLEHWYPVTAGTVHVDFATWGMPTATEAQLEFFACDAQTFATCGLDRSVFFHPVDATPAVTWPAQDKIGSALPPYQVTVSDPLGDGSTLRVEYAGWTDQSVDRNGTTTLTLQNPPDDPAGAVITLLRCDVRGSLCTPTTAVSPVVVTKRTRAPGFLDLLEVAKIPANQPGQTLPLRFCTAEAGTAQITWSIERESEPAEWTTVPGLGEADQTLSSDAAQDACTTIDADVSTLPLGRYRVAWAMTKDVGEYGVVSAARTSFPFTAVLDHTTGAVTTSTSDLNPYAHGRIDGVYNSYHDTIGVHVTSSANFVSRTQQVLDAHGRVVSSHTIESADYRDDTWDGTDQDGHVVPAGRYVIREKLLLDAGYVRTFDSAPITLTHQRLVIRTWTKHVTAKQSLVTVDRAKCQQVRFGGAGNAPDTLTLTTRRSCDRAPNFVDTVSYHQLRLPPVLRYRHVGLSVDARDGGADAGKWSANVAYWAQGNRWRGFMFFPRARRVAELPLVHAFETVSKGNTFRWRVGMDSDGSFELRGFTVRLRYVTLG